MTMQLPKGNKSDYRFVEFLQVYGIGCIYRVFPISVSTFAMTASLPEIKSATVWFNRYIWVDTTIWHIGFGIIANKGDIHFDL